VLNLQALVQIKLTAYRDKDKTRRHRRAEKLREKIFFAPSVA
jgi:hypothetical protein